MAYIQTAEVVGARMDEPIKERKESAAGNNQHEPLGEFQQVLSVKRRLLQLSAYPKGKRTGTTARVHCACNGQPGNRMPLAGIILPGHTQHEWAVL